MVANFPKTKVADHQPSANTAAVAALAAVPGQFLFGLMAHWSYSGAPTGGKLTISTNSVVISEVDITAAGPGFLDLTGFNSQKGYDLTATLAAGGSGVSGKVSISAGF